LSIYLIYNILSFYFSDWLDVPDFPEDQDPMDTISAAHRIVRRANLDSNSRNSLLQTENFVEGFLRQMTLDEAENPFGATRSNFEILDAARTAKEWFERGLLKF
jgi:hypothetical protein